jgi:hypothetical protein
VLHTEDYANYASIQGAIQVLGLQRVAMDIGKPTEMRWATFNQYQDGQRRDVLSTLLLWPIQLLIITLNRACI